MTIEAIFRAGFVRRWHSNPDLAHTVDRVDGHSARVAKFLMYLWPESRVEAIKAALLHDDGEISVGDMSFTLKRRRPDIAHGLDQIEAAHINEIWGSPDVMTSCELMRIKFCDRLDAFLWARQHAPQVLDGDGWPEAIQHLVEQSVNFCVMHKTRDLLEASE